jgi:hypothetical protein
VRAPPDGIVLAADRDSARTAGTDRAQSRAA